MSNNIIYFRGPSVKGEENKIYKFFLVKEPNLSVDIRREMRYNKLSSIIVVWDGEIMKTVAFPKLGLSFNIDPILLHIGDGGIHWYGVIIAVGVMLALLLCGYLYKSRGREPEEIVDFLLWALPFGIIGARLYYVFFSWDSGSYADDPMEIVRVWNGGLAIYGGIIAGFIVALVFCRLKRIAFLEFADVCAPGLALGQCLGRWGNFVNGEAHGGETSLPWGMTINGSEPVHPTFLYESLWSLIGLAILVVVVKKCLPAGSALFIYFMWYGAGRFFIEGLRTDSLYVLPGVRVSQIVAAVTALAGLAGLIITAVGRKKPRK